ncbi:MAG: glycosyltransferase family 2 protein [Candidatus Methanoperedens sp.]|nr:glycosyltransferase family 2 protein [Candidatus Methanoperedens sp.]
MLEKGNQKPVSVSLVIPAYNEENRIKNVMTRYLNFFPDFEIIVVCDGTDNTASIVKEFMDKYAQIKLLEFNERLGKGKGIIEGMKIARGNNIGFVDSDESIDPGDVGKMVDTLSGSDGVIASRRLKQSRIIIKQSLMRRISSRAFNILVNIIFNLGFEDTQCGAKFFRRGAICDVLNDMKTKEFEFDVELLWKLKKKGYNVVEYPITWKHSEGSSFSLFNGPKMIFSLLRVRLWS